MNSQSKRFLEKYKPGVSKRNLLLIAGCVWTIAGGILITRGLIQVISSHHLLLPKFTLGLAGGIVFFLLLFSKISSKHISRISLIKVEDPCFFSFFNFRSYVMMVIMIIGGITLRKLNVINPEILFTFFLAMGIPLLMSAFRFFYSWAKNNPGS